MRTSLTVLIPLLIAAPLAAQQRDTVSAAGVRADTADADSAATDTVRVQRLAPQVVTGTRLSGAADERTPVQVDLIDLRDAVPGPSGAAEVVSRLPGVSAFDDQGTRVQPTLNIRGFTLSPVVGVPQGVSVFLDGVRINEADAQQVYFDLIPIEAVDRAELIRGPASLFGKNSLAGALVLSTARGSADPRFEVEAEGGAFGYRGLRGTASGRFNGLDGFLYAGGSEEEGYRAVTDARRRMVFATVGRRRENSDAALSVLYANNKVYQAGSLPESWLEVKPDTNYTGGDFFAPELLHIAFRGERPLLGGRLRGNLYDRLNEYEQFNVNVDDPDTRAFIRNNSFGGTAELILPLTVGPRPLSLTFGAEYTRNLVRYRIFNEPNAAAPVLDPEECDIATGLCENARVNEDNVGVFAQAVLGVTGRLWLTAAARADYVRVPFRDIQDPENNGTNTFRQISPRLGFNYMVGDKFRGYASIGRGFRAPAALELACADETAPCPLPFSLGDDPALDPVTVTNYETGIDWEPREGTALDVVAFRSDVRDEVVFVASERAAGFFQNVARTRRQGIEAYGTLALPAGFRTFASYTYLDATYQSTVQLASAVEDAEPAEPGDRFPLSPAHRATFGVGATRLAGRFVLDGELSVNAVSSQYLRGDDANNFEPLAGYAVTNLRLTVDHQHFAVSAYITNLLDRDYVTFGIFGENPVGPIGGPPPDDDDVVERFLNPGYPRALTISVRAKL